MPARVCKVRRVARVYKVRWVDGYAMEADFHWLVSRYGAAGDA